MHQIRVQHRENVGESRAMADKIINVTEDGGITKEILVEGDGEVPQQGYKVQGK